MNNEILKQILLNQREILHGVSCLLTPLCNGSLIDLNGETRCNVKLIDRLHETDDLIKKKFRD